MTRKSVPFTTAYSVKHDTKYVWVGSISSFWVSAGYFRLFPVSGRRNGRSSCLKGASSGLVRCSKQHRYGNSQCLRGDAQSHVATSRALHEQQPIMEVDLDHATIADVRIPVIGDKEV
jgi:hypothetical protein